MTRYAQVVNGTATDKRLPGMAQRLDTGEWVAFTYADEATMNACGWYSYETVAPPAVTASQIAVHVGPVFNAGTVTDTWTVRDKTAGELTADAAVANSVTLRQQATAALVTNTDALALPDPTGGNNTFLAIGTPTTAQNAAQIRALTQQANALVAQVRALTHQNTKLIRLALGLFDGTD